MSIPNFAILSRVGIARCGAAAFAIAFALCSRPLPARAQDVPTAFVHGFFSNGPAWSATATYLSGRVSIAPFTPTTPWDQHFSVQSASLRDALNTWGMSNVVTFAHSNGGLTSRNYVQQNAGSGRINRLVTIGTPHFGAPIATNVLNGRVVGFFGGMAYSIGAAGNFYANNDPAWSAGPVIDYATQNAFAYLQYFGGILADNNALIGLGFGALLPVINDDVPASPFLSTLNSGAGIGAEAGALSYRVGISTQAHPNGVLFRLASTDPEGWRRVQKLAAYGALVLYNYYSRHPDYYLASQAYRWALVYNYLINIDVAWQDFIGAYAYRNGPFIMVSPSDGFIPGSQSQFPGAGSQYNMYLPQYNVTHVEQMDHSAMRAQYELLLTRDLGVPRRPYVNPPPDPGNECAANSTMIIC